MAELYGVETRAVNQAVKRNPDKFPSGYLIYLDSDDWDCLKSQIETSDENLESIGIATSPSISQNVISKVGRGGRQKSPWAFTEHGVAMLSSVLKSPTAARVNIEIIRTFVRLRVPVRLSKEQQKPARHLPHGLS